MLHSLVCSRSSNCFLDKPNAKLRFSISEYLLDEAKFVVKFFMVVTSGLNFLI